MNDIELALSIAYHAHEGQKDKGGEPYILHPLFMALNSSTVEEKIVALLHDVVEDTKVTLENLKVCGFSEDIIAAIDAITKRKGEELEVYYERVLANPLALKVKIKDTYHNSMISRIPNPTQEDFERSKKYRTRYYKLLSYTGDYE